MVVLFFSGIYLKAQNTILDFQKEKTYVQTSHVFYKPGETMDFKIYVINAQSNLPSELSKVVNFELIDPSGSVVSKLKYEIKNGHAEGSYYFGNGMKGGIYKIRAFTNWMQNEEGKNAFEKEITLQKIVSPRILMKLDFPKKGYGAGDEVLADFSMRSLSNLPIPFYEASYTVMHDGEMFSEGKLITDKEGKYQLKFKFPAVLKSSDALLNIKVNFDGFTESISRNIPIVLNNLEVKFMPEGGTFINGIEQNVAFKVVDEFEKPVDATIAIFNQNDKKIVEISAYNFGMGNFSFTPEKDENYYARIIKPENIVKVYPLPIAKNEGIVFNINKENGQLKLKLISTDEKEIIIKGSFREKDTVNQKVLVKKGNNFVELSEKNLPVGICRFTVSDHEIPLAERIVFANESRQMKVTIKPSKQNYLPREKVVVKIETIDENDKPIPANLALSVVDDKLWTYADDKQNHLVSWLLMDSELRGKIEKPQFYFDKKEEKAKKSLDLVMLTNGYRYFELLPEINNTKKYKYLPEKRNPIYGVVEDEHKNPVKAEVFLVEDGYNGTNKMVKQVTDENGLFYFSDLSNAKPYKIIAKSFKPRHKVNIRILAYKLNINPLTKSEISNINVEEIVKEAVEKQTEKKKELINKSSVRKSVDKISRQQNIGEVVITGALGIKKRSDALTSSSQIVRTEEIQSNTLGYLLQGKVSGLEISAVSNQPSGNIMIRGSRSMTNKKPLFVVDGIPVENFNINVNTNDLNSVTVLKDAAATALYGSQGANGVILITSSKYGNGSINFDITPKSYIAVKAIPHDSLVSYTGRREFSYPVYESTNTSYRFDYRENIYWNPVIETDKNGKATVEFYNSDANTTFRILTEGISANGLLGRDETTYAAQSLISIDAKIPQYVTRTDQMTIPVVVKNNSSETKTMKMDVMVPDHVKLIQSDSLITLKPLESGILLVKIQTDEVVSSNIQFTVRASDFRETMILPFNVDEKGFPHYYSIIGNTSENNKINIPGYINRSFFSSYYVFENSALSMFEDMERLKREPYGCFEQLSSTVYPNIFILDYLKTSGKLKADLEGTAVKNLKKGFEKMLNYKNKDGGFGYFNASESDVSISALALLEFTDLKKVIKIDEKLIQNLKMFILSKKNKNGIFDVRKSYEINAPFSEYSWSRNMYVLYALSKIGLKNELEDSYAVALNRAMATKDSYQLALMANTSSYLKKEGDYAKIINMLNLQFENKNIKPATTFTGSGRMSANAETLSLYLMALQKNSEDNQLKIAEVADELIGYNGYYGFGSTQATSLALEALSGFFSKNEKLYGVEKPIITANGAEISSTMSSGSAFKNGENEVLINYPNSKKGLPYKLEYQYYTLEPPKSSDIPLTMETKLKSQHSKVGETNRMMITIKNKVNGQLPMITAKIGIPAGLTLQNALLKDMIDKKQVSYFEIFDNYLVLYWEHLEANETKVINLDLKVEFAGEYTGKASNVYLYYTPESKFWNEGIKTKIEL
ncbi:TonB-dependent receptor plug domain-containing protein [Chryseobacterium sp. Leaf405]|uniref:TonB-dependent receptor plug domain-containing protein n=1 Tax=Chryseobacterium sp. Leaf405 TaxID=1736367 RepID=UPI000AAA8F11|nr:TonB-dependent receptor plug domain-containing protein [Chryseobacterium sp. Leaf405]